ncbi:retrovirus-related pol polyprotein from transposon TNT 1-94, partial [Tanacetum coccineum]
SVNVVSSSFTIVDPRNERTQRNEFESIFGQDKDANLPTAPLMPELEDTRIFSGAYDDEVEGVVADLNNLKLTIVIEAMQDELLQFRLQKVWRLVDLPKGKHAIGTKWVYRNKKDERGIVVRNKARLVAQCYTQEEGIDYDEVLALIARIEAIMLFLAYASFMGFIVYQMDVKSAFLYGTIEEEVYVCQPPGFEDPQLPDKVYKVEKALYGLHQAPKAWYEILSTYLLENGFRREIIDKNLFIKKDKEVPDEFYGGAHFLLRVAVSTPIETNKALLKDEEAEDVDVHLYRSMIGSLMYLTASRPDIMFAVCDCVRFQVTHKVSHLHAMKRIFGYLKGQPKLGLWYPRDSPFDLEAFLDSDYAGASLDRKCTTGGCQFLSKRLISWQCKKQTVVTNSTTKAEYVAAANCCGQNSVSHSKTKHIKIRHHFIRDSYEKRLIQVIKIHTDHNVADLLTKAFDVSSIRDKFGNKTGSYKVNTARQAKHIEYMVLNASPLNGPPEKVGDEAVYKELGDIMERAATTTSSLEAEQDSGNINRTQSMATLNELSPYGTGSGSGPRCQDTILGGVDAQTRFETTSK